MERLSDAEKPVRISAMLSLGKLGQGQSPVQDALIVFAEDSDPQIRLNAVVALASLGKIDDTVIPMLVQALSIEEVGTAKAASRALGNLGVKEPEKVLPKMTEILEKKHDPASGYALRVLKQMKAQAAPALPQISALYDASEAATRIIIVEAVTAIDAKGDYALPVLFKALKEADSNDRKDALLGLMRFRSKGDALVGHLAGALRDSDAENRLLAVGIIRGLGQEGTAAVPDLLTLTNDPDHRVRNAAINAVVIYRPLPPEVVPALDKALKESDSRVRNATVNALRNLGADHPEKVTPILKDALQVEKHGPSKRLIESALESISKGQDSQPADSFGKVDKDERRKAKDTK